MTKFLKNLLVLSFAAAAVGGMWHYSEVIFPPSKTYNNLTGLIPDTPKAKELVNKCQSTPHFGDQNYNSSWRFSMMGGDVAFFYCGVEEKIDWRERGRLDFCATNPPRRYNWMRRIEW